MCAKWLLLSARQFSVTKIANSFMPSFESQTHSCLLHRLAAIYRKTCKTLSSATQVVQCLWIVHIRLCSYPGCDKTVFQGSIYGTTSQSQNKYTIKCPYPNYKALHAYLPSSGEHDFHAAVQFLMQNGMLCQEAPAVKLQPRFGVGSGPFLIARGGQKEPRHGSLFALQTLRQEILDFPSSMLH